MKNFLTESDGKYCASDNFHYITIKDAMGHDDDKVPLANGILKAHPSVTISIYNKHCNNLLFMNSGLKGCDGPEVTICQDSSSSTAYSLSLSLVLCKYIGNWIDG